MVAGGAGYIGSPVASALSGIGHEPVTLDNLVTGRREFAAGRPSHEGDRADGELVDRVLADQRDIAAVLH